MNKFRQINIKKNELTFLGYKLNTKEVTMGDKYFKTIQEHI